MAVNGGGPPLMKEENSVGQNVRTASLAERRAAKCGFNAACLNMATAPSSPQPYFTAPPGLALSPSEMLDSPVMLPNPQAPLSPTTGTFQILLPDQESLEAKMNISCNGEDAIPMETEAHLNFMTHENMPLENSMNMQEMSQKECVDQRSNNSTMLEQQQQVKTEKSLHPNPKKSGPIPKEMSKTSDDEFLWRKYGQKHVKGSEHPRSYYKCTNSNCHVTKKVERSPDGQVIKIVYKGFHNHPKPHNLGGFCTIKTEPKDSASSSNDSAEPMFQTHFEFAAVDWNEASPDQTQLLSCNGDDDNGECEAKKRKTESFPNETPVARSAREPKVVVQIESDIDILDDGYRWRKYGQKVVKGNPNPRSYYKCTTPGCPVRKHVERAADDIKSVITTYEGKHDHDIPSSKNAVANLPPPSLTLTNTVIPPSKPAEARKAAAQQAQFQELKPISNYMTSNLSGNFPGDLIDLGPLPPFPFFHSLPYGSMLMNRRTYPTSSSHYMPSSQMNHVATSAPARSSTINHHPPPLGGGYNYGISSYAVAHHQLQQLSGGPDTTTPKEEQLEDEDDTSLFIPSPSNGTM